MLERITTAGVLERDGLFLIAKRREGGAIGEMWEFPGGKNRYGESEAETLVREWKEELNLEIGVGSFICSHDFTNKETLYHLKAYQVSCDDFSPMRLFFHTDVRFVTKEKLHLFRFAPSDQHVVNALLQGDER
jgi:8-oxo-dGTP diphosphatase